MMECKRALIEAQGDQDKAVEILRKRGEKVLSDKAGRETSEGRVDCFMAPDGSVVGMVQMHCEQAPSAKNERFVSLTAALAKQAALCEPEPTVENLLEQPDVDDPSRPARQRLLDVINQIRENMSVARVARLKADGGVLGYYVHFNNQEGAIVRLEGGTATQELANDLAMHIVAAKPIAATRDQVPEDVLERERDIAKAQAEQMGKPPQVAEKIAQGKLNAWLAEKVLVEQVFVKDGKTKVRDLLKNAGGARVTHFYRFKVGELK